MSKVDEKTYLKPKLGRTVYCIYDGGIFVDTVGYVGKNSFIVDSFGSSTYEDSWEWYYDTYNSDWFTNLAKAKKALLEQMEDEYGCEFKIVKVYDDWYEAKEKGE